MKDMVQKAADDSGYSRLDRTQPSVKSCNLEALSSEGLTTTITTEVRYENLHCIFFQHYLNFAVLVDAGSVQHTKRYIYVKLAY